MKASRAVFVHPWALCEANEIGEGTRVWAFAHVMAGASIGRHCNICGHVFIESGVVIGDRVVVKNGVSVFECVHLEDDVFVGPNVTFTNDLRPRAAFKAETSSFQPTKVRQGASIGANATIVCGVELGPCAFVGAGAVVTHDVLAHALVVGVPARQSGWVCACGNMLDGRLTCRCGRRYQRVETGLSLVPNSGPR